MLTTENTRPGGAPMYLSIAEAHAVAQCILWYNAQCFRRGAAGATLAAVGGGFVVRMPSGHEYDPKTWCRMYEDFKRRLGLPHKEVD